MQIEFTKDQKSRFDELKKLHEQLKLKFELITYEKFSLEKKIFNMTEEIKDGKYSL